MSHLCSISCPISCPILCPISCPILSPILPAERSCLNCCVVLCPTPQPPAQPGMLAALHQNMSSSGPLLLVETTPTLVSSAQQSLQNGPLEDTPVHVMFSPLSVAESSRHNSLQSLILTLVNNKLDQSLPFSQQQQHVLSEVLHIVRQNYPEYGEESVRGLIAAQLKISQEHKLTPKRGITNGDGGRSDTEIVTLRTVCLSS